MRPLEQKEFSEEKSFRERSRNDNPFLILDNRLEWLALLRQRHHLATLAQSVEIIRIPLRQIAACDPMLRPIIDATYASHLMRQTQLDHVSRKFRLLIQNRGSGRPETVRAMPAIKTDFPQHRI